MTDEPVIVSPNPGELEPCPFCGAEAGFEHDASGSFAQWYVYCRDMKEGCPIGYTNTIGYARRTEAARGWNKRA